MLPAIAVSVATMGAGAPAVVANIASSATTFGTTYGKTYVEERRKGYATEMLKLVLAVAKKTGIDKVLLTCDIDNIASCKTVEKCGGKKGQEEAFVLDGEPYYKYWIVL